MSFATDWLDLVISADGGAATITAENMFHDKHIRFFIENLVFGGGYWEPLGFEFRDGG